MKARDWGFFRSKKGLSRVRLAFSKLPAHLAKDLGRNFVNTAEFLGLRDRAQAFAERFRGRPEAQPSLFPQASANHAVATKKPLIFLSACVDKERHGGWKYNGGIKLLNNLTKLLRNHGYEAYMVTYDGNYEPWLIDHQPHMSLADFRQRVKADPDVRCVTSWAKAKGFIAECPALYFWDMELAWTEHSQFPLLARLYRTKIKRAAGLCQTIQAWHMAHFERSCVTVPLLVDEAFWSPSEGERRARRVGYMAEGTLTETYIDAIRKTTLEAGLDLEFFLLRGPESDILAGMRSCEVFLGMNVGKDPLWGEGGVLPTLESISAGCVLIAFDVQGNREIVQNGFNGFIVQTRRPDLMAARLINVYTTDGELARVRANAALLWKTAQTMEARWPVVREFLELGDAP